MDFTLLHFNEETGQVTVGCATMLDMVLDVPIENGSYLAGDALYSYIAGFIPRADIARRALVASKPVVPESLKAISTPEQVHTLTYKELREAEYPNVMDFIDGMVKGDSEQMQVYIDTCLAVKAKHPKPIPEPVSEEVLKSRREL